jgi:hypothetical protein
MLRAKARDLRVTARGAHLRAPEAERLDRVEVEPAAVVECAALLVRDAP